jgi:hypothetical protein
VKWNPFSRPWNPSTDQRARDKFSDVASRLTAWGRS